MSHQFNAPEDVMRRAIELARRGCGLVEPNPPVGAVIVDARLRRIAEGFHRQFGGAHAEVEAITQAADRARGQTLFVTLEPCCHTGKTPPCTQAILEAGIRRVIVGVEDPADHAVGRGIAELKAAGLDVQSGLLEREARQLIAPFSMLHTRRRPWVHAKWAMSLDGKLATFTGHSQWISHAESRQHVHRLRGRMDAILVGARTARLDDPLLTARPPGPRTPLRVVMDRTAGLNTDCRLLQTVADVPVLLVAGQEADESHVRRLRELGVEVLQWQLPELDSATRAEQVLQELGRRNMTHVLVEGGGALLGAFRDADLIDEVHVFVAPKLVGGRNAVSPMAGMGLECVPDMPQIDELSVHASGSDVYLHGRVRRTSEGSGPATDPRRNPPTE